MSDLSSFICSDELRLNVKANLSKFEAVMADDDSLRRAAVAIVVTDVGPGADINGLQDIEGWSDQAAIILTRRSEKLKNHPGQWALPGGKLDTEENYSTCALRELEEEVGVSLSINHVLGFLDDFVTRSGFAITPVVVWGGTELETTINPQEVASVHRIPVTQFFRSDAPRLTKVNTSEHPILRMPVGSDVIAAPTAAIIYQFKEVCLCGRPTKVSHYEQPRFAWE